MAAECGSRRLVRPARGGRQWLWLIGTGNVHVSPSLPVPLACATTCHGARVVNVCCAVRTCLVDTHRRKGRTLRTYSNGKACTAVSFCCCLTGFPASLAIHWCTMLAISCVYICVAVRSFELHVAWSGEWSHNAVKPMCRREFLHTTRHGLRIGMVPSRVVSPY